MRISAIALSLSILAAAEPASRAGSDAVSVHGNILSDTHLIEAAPSGYSVAYSGHPESPANRKTFRKALGFYKNGAYTRARELFDNLASSGPDIQAEGYSLLCAIRLKTDGYGTALAKYVSEHPYSGLLPEIYFRHALNLFDAEQYAAAGKTFGMLSAGRIEKWDVPEYEFKKAYCDFETGDHDGALHGFNKVHEMPLNDFSAPARYSAGYIYYSRRKVDEALKWFAMSVKDPRFEDISNYYIMECHFLKKDYDYVVEHAPVMYGNVPEDRKPHLARIISESYLVKGDAARAKEYYDLIGASEGKERGDYFYSGSVLYAVKDYKGAVDNFTMMTDRTDSIGQIAEYQSGYSYIQMKNKVAALNSFKNASALDFDKAIKEDAFFNYAKLSFDLNNDASVFNRYLGIYSDKAKGARIYGYMALAALYNRDYAGAVEAYDKIDDLDGDMRSNYMKANYLRAHQLIGSGSYRNAVPCLRAAAYYSDKRSFFNQLSRYWLAEAYFRDARYSQARDLFTELYNVSALDGKEEGRLIPYNIAYCHFKEGAYDLAEKWFDKYIASGNASNRKDAMVRKADGYFFRKDYKAASAAYGAAVGSYPDADDVYPYYQEGISYGLAGDNARKIAALSAVRQASPRAEFYNDAMFELGRAYLADGNDSEASKCYGSIVTGAQDSTYVAKALLGLGTIARNGGRTDEALGHYKKVVANMPSTEFSADAMLAIESIYQQRQEPEVYLAYVESLGEGKSGSDKDREDMLFNSAEQIFLAGNYQKALVSLQAYQDRYPQGAYSGRTYFYMAECYKNTARKEQACDYYRKASDSGDSSFAELSALNYAELSYGMDRFADAYAGYEKLGQVAVFDANKYKSQLGMMRSAFSAKEYGKAIEAAVKVYSHSSATAVDKRLSEYVRAKSLLATSRRSDALSIMRKLAADPSSAEGAEAAYTLILDSFDRGDFAAVEEKAYALSDSRTGQTYWLAKSFIVLGDSFAEREDFAQAKATFESIRDGYKPSGPDDDVLDNVAIRLKKLQ